MTLLAGTMAISAYIFLNISGRRLAMPQPPFPIAFSPPFHYCHSCMSPFSPCRFLLPASASSSGSR
jgi:hypothetical protein